MNLSELEDRLAEITQAEKQKGKDFKNIPQASYITSDSLTYL